MQIKSEWDYQKIGRKSKLSPRVLKIFVKFMMKRFPISTYFIVESYAQDWALRFKSGHPETFMDSESKKICEEVIKNEI
jgi:hypothetical protein